MYTNAAYGFVKVPLSELAANPDIELIQSEIQRRYTSFVPSDTLQ